MTKISLIAKLTAADGKIEELKTALGALIEASDEEAGLEIYSAHQSQDDANVMYFFELYTSAEAFEVHGKGDKMKAAMGAMGGLLGGRPEVTMLDPIVAKGLDI